MRLRHRAPRRRVELLGRAYAIAAHALTGQGKRYDQDPNEVRRRSARD